MRSKASTIHPQATANSSGEDTRSNQPIWRPGLRASLLLAFSAITGFVMLTAAAAFLAFQVVGERLQLVESRAPVTLSALTLSRSAERIIATAPALLAAREPAQRRVINAELAAEMEKLEAELDALDFGRLPLPSHLALKSAAADLTQNLAALDTLVARRLATARRVKRAQFDVLQINVDVQRLLAPWLEIVDGEIAALAGDVRLVYSVADDSSNSNLLSLLRQRKQLEQAQRRFSAAVDTVNEIVLGGQIEQVPILEFRRNLALRRLRETASTVDSRLRSMLLDEVDKLEVLGGGRDALAAARTRELDLLVEGERRLTETSDSATRLSAAVDRLGIATTHDVEDAILAAVDVQRASSRVLVVLVSLSLVGSVLIVWLYVGRRVVRRIVILGDAMRSIASGDLDRPFDTRGSDEIAAMGHAVEILRRNTVERNALQLQQEQAAEQLEDEVAARTAELAKADAFKARFLAVASHDLRQPLHALNLFVAQLRETSESSTRDPLLARIDASLMSMNELFDSLLDMTRLEAGLLEAVPSVFPVSQLLESLENTFSSAAQAKGLQFRVVASRQSVRSDPLLLERIAMNLVANAVRHTERGGVVIGCRRSGSDVRLDICDSGPGIATDRRQEIFSEFRKLVPVESEGNAESEDGLGLGLAIVEGLAQLLGHNIELDSRPGRGSRFSIVVPGVSGPDQPADMHSFVMPPMPLFAESLNGRLIVVIDDDEPVREGMRGTLEQWGCHVVTAASAQEAIERVAANAAQPDLIIADCHLGDTLSGIDAIRHVRQTTGQDVEAFLVSGDTTAELAHEASASGHHLLRKPIRPIRLRAIMQQLIGIETVDRNCRVSESREESTATRRSLIRGFPNAAVRNEVPMSECVKEPLFPSSSDPYSLPRR